MRQLSPTTRRRQRGFSLTELLVAISIIIGLIALTFPVLRVLTSSSRVEAGINIVGMSADVARQWVAAKAWDSDATDSVQNERYSGTAAIYCPTGEIRITFNARNAQAASGTPLALEDRSPERNGYADIPGVEYIVIPDGVGLVGIQRTGSAATDVRFIAPPFAIAFNENGQMSFGDTNGLVYYNSNGDTSYDLSQTRASVSGYDPEDWNGLPGATNASPISGQLVKALPFEAIECVPGVVIFNQYDFDQAGLNFAGGGAATLSSAAGQWIQANGRTLFFSPHTGVALRDEQQE